MTSCPNGPRYRGPNRYTLITRLIPLAVSHVGGGKGARTNDRRVLIFSWNWARDLGASRASLVRADFSILFGGEELFFLAIKNNKRNILLLYVIRLYERNVIYPRAR